VGETETIHYYHFDELGSTQFLTATDGTVTDKYTYDAWGNIVSHIGDIDQPYQYVGEMGYYTHTQDTNLKMMQLGVRLYDMENGRFVQLDTVGDGMNWYNYANSSPLVYIDTCGYKARHRIPKPLPRHMPQPKQRHKIRIPRVKTPESSIKKALKFGGKILRVKSCIDNACRVAAALIVTDKCGIGANNPFGDDECVDEALQELLDGAKIWQDEGGIIEPQIIRYCVFVVKNDRRNADWIRDGWKWFWDHKGRSW
jgi:RHS repeat-associated protein